MAGKRALLLRVRAELEEKPSTCGVGGAVCGAARRRGGVSGVALKALSSTLGCYNAQGTVALS